MDRGHVDVFRSRTGAALGRVPVVEFTYRLTGTGWAEARGLLDGAQQTRCSWAQEPAESRWIFDRTGSDVRVRVLAFRDAELPEPDDRGRVVFQSTVPLRELAGAVSGAAQEVLEELGDDGYLRLWMEHPFPAEQLQLIQAHLAAG